MKTEQDHDDAMSADIVNDMTHGYLAAVIKYMVSAGLPGIAVDLMPEEGDPTDRPRVTLILSVHEEVAPKISAEFDRLMDAAFPGDRTNLMCGPGVPLQKVTET